MNIEEKKGILKEYSIMINRYKELNKVMLPSIRYGEPRLENGGGYSPLTRIIDEKTEIEKKLWFIEKAISKIKDTEKKYILEYHYVEGMSLSEIERKDLLHYSRAHLGRLRDQAVNEVELAGYKEL